MRTRTKSTSCRSRWRSDRKKTDGMRKESVDQPCGRLKWRAGFWFVSGRPPTGRVNPLRTATLSWTVTRLWTSSSGSRWATFLYRVEMSVATKDQLQSLAGVTEEQAGRVTAGGHYRLLLGQQRSGRCGDAARLCLMSPAADPPMSG